MQSIRIRIRIHFKSIRIHEYFYLEFFNLAVYHYVPKKTNKTYLINTFSQ